MATIVHRQQTIRSYGSACLLTEDCT